MRTIIILGSTVFALALYLIFADTYALGPHLVSEVSPYAGVAPMSLSAPPEGRAAYVDSPARPRAPEDNTPLSRGR
jgi:hypothetical protein